MSLNVFHGHPLQLLGLGRAVRLLAAEGAWLAVSDAEPSGVLPSTKVT